MRTACAAEPPTCVLRTGCSVTGRGRCVCFSPAGIGGGCTVQQRRGRRCGPAPRGSRTRRSRPGRPRHGPRELRPGQCSAPSHGARAWNAPGTTRGTTWGPPGTSGSTGSTRGPPNATRLPGTTRGAPGSTGTTGGAPRNAPPRPRPASPDKWDEPHGRSSRSSCRFR